ncbi:MAG TPA: hypothetical protein VGZ31_00335 [Chthoniobacterales bacterium]|nr:hypothetical protein [Chthoniobacterales bacterium]
MKAIARCLLVALTICSWIAISNHCSLRALATKTDTTESGCPFHSKPAKPQPPAGTECCKILRAVSTTPAKILAPAIVDLAFDTLAVFPPPKISFTPATLDTGPPDRTSFIELIESMRALAPPVRA